MRTVIAFVLFLVTGVLCCGPNELACGVACYLASQYSCNPNNLLCPVNWQVCESQCYNPNIYDCVQTAQYNYTSNQYLYTLCPKGDSNCGQACYDPNVYTCWNQYNGYMCQVGYDLCGTTSCYDPSQFQCIQSSLSHYVCPLGLNLVCNGSCVADTTPCPGNVSPSYCCTDPSGCFGANYVTCPGSLRCCAVYPQWEASAGGTCYDSTLTSCSGCPVYNPNHPIQSLCPIDAPICCEEGCLPTTQQCCHEYLSYDSWGCPASDSCCGYNNIAQAVCCPSGTSCKGDTPTTTPYCA